MKRQPYYPKLLPLQPEWHHNFATKLPNYATVLGLVTAQVNAAVADNQMMEYALGDWISNVRDFAPACTSSLEILASGTGGDPFVFPVFNLPTAPTLPVGFTDVLPGALDRTFLVVKEIKAKLAYTEAIGIDLGIVGEADTVEHARPEFSLKSEGGNGCHCVKVRFKKFGHTAVAIYCKRGTGGWDLLAVSEISPYQDERPLLMAGQPEVREYKMRFWDNSTESGEWTDVASVTVSP
jgi:hypothetical protein